MDWLIGRGRRKSDKDGGAGVVEDSSKLYLDPTFANDQLYDGDLQDLVRVPHGMDMNEWLASHTLSFFHNISALYSSLSEFCTVTLCPAMTAPCSVQYHWLDERGKKCKCAAPQYIDYVLTYVHTALTDDNVLPSKHGQTFPVGFDFVIRKILRLLLHVIGHLYHAHFRQLVALDLHRHLNSLFKHYALFVSSHTLVDSKELEILEELLRALLAADDRRNRTEQTTAAESVSIATTVADDGESSTLLTAVSPGHVTSDGDNSSCRVPKSAEHVSPGSIPHLSSTKNAKNRSPTQSAQPAAPVSRAVQSHAHSSSNSTAAAATVSIGGEHRKRRSGSSSNGSATAVAEVVVY